MHVDEIVLNFRLLRPVFSAIAARSYGKQERHSGRIRGGFVAPFPLIRKRFLDVSRFRSP
jgi:hypothetical protein